MKRWYAQGDGSSPTPVLYFVYDGWNLLQEGTSPWNPSHVYFHGARVDEIVASYNGVTGVMAYHYYDASGHCTMLTDWQGNIMEQYYYDAFGYPYFFDGLGNGLGYSPHGNRFLFTGREWIEPLKVYDFRNRLYHPELDRFMQPDPKEFAAGDYNLYRYCHNDPVNRVDPFGLIDKEIPPQINRLGAQAAENSLAESARRHDGNDTSQAVQQAKGKQAELNKTLSPGVTTEDHREYRNGRVVVFHKQIEPVVYDRGTKLMAVGHNHSDLTGRPSPHSSKFSEDDIKLAKSGVPVYKINESNPGQVLRLTPQVNTKGQLTYEAPTEVVISLR